MGVEAGRKKCTFGGMFSGDRARVHAYIADEYNEARSAEFEAGPEGDATGEQNLITGMVSLSGCMAYSFIETGASQSFIALRPLLIETCVQPNLERKY